MAIIDRKNSQIVTVKERYPLTKGTSTKQTWHVTLDLSNAPLVEYHPGDSIGVYAQNDPVLVDHLIEALSADPNTIITEKKTKEKMSLKKFFGEYANLSRITSSFLKLIYEGETSGEKKKKLAHLLDPNNKPFLKEYLSSEDPLGLFREFSLSKVSLQDLCDQFGPLLPRFYSIASSKKQSPHTLDLTVSLFTWLQGDEKRYGVASHFLCHLAEIHKTPIPIFVQPALHFRLPKDPSTDIIMVGPGTGVAPFRAFMQERAHHGASGKHILFFGERNQQSDFFYENEWKTHNLNVHTAFSRDQEEKIYVQHRMLEQSETIFAQLESGAHLYVCGDATQMAKDVDKTLQQIVQTEGNLSEEDAKDYLRSLKKSGRYLLDVY